MARYTSPTAEKSRKEQAARGIDYRSSHGDLPSVPVKGVEEGKIVQEVQGEVTPPMQGTRVMKGSMTAPIPKDPNDYPTERGGALRERGIRHVIVKGGRPRTEEEKLEAESFYMSPEEETKGNIALDAGRLFALKAQERAAKEGREPTPFARHEIDIPVYKTGTDTYKYDRMVLAEGDRYAMRLYSEKASFKDGLVQPTRAGIDEVRYPQPTIEVRAPARPVSTLSGQKQRGIQARGYIEEQRKQGLYTDENTVTQVDVKSTPVYAGLPSMDGIKPLTPAVAAVAVSAKSESDATRPYGLTEKEYGSLNLLDKILLKGTEKDIVPEYKVDTPLGTYTSSPITFTGFRENPRKQLPMIASKGLQIGMIAGYGWMAALTKAPLTVAGRIFTGGKAGLSVLSFGIASDKYYKHIVMPAEQAMKNIGASEKVLTSQNPQLDPYGITTKLFTAAPTAIKVAGVGGAIVTGYGAAKLTDKAVGVVTRETQLAMRGGSKNLNVMNKKLSNVKIEDFGGKIKVTQDVKGNMLRKSEFGLGKDVFTGKEVKVIDTQTGASKVVSNLKVDRGLGTFYKPDASIPQTLRITATGTSEILKSKTTPPNKIIEKFGFESTVYEKKPKFSKDSFLQEHLKASNDPKYSERIIDYSNPSTGGNRHTIITERGPIRGLLSESDISTKLPNLDVKPGSLSSLSYTQSPLTQSSGTLKGFEATQQYVPRTIRFGGGKPIPSQNILSTTTPSGAGLKDIAGKQLTFDTIYTTPTKGVFDVSEQVRKYINANNYIPGGKRIRTDSIVTTDNMKVVSTGQGTSYKLPYQQPKSSDVLRSIDVKKSSLGFDADLKIDKSIRTLGWESRPFKIKTTPSTPKTQVLKTIQEVKPTGLGLKGFDATYGSVSNYQTPISVSAINTLLDVTPAGGLKAVYTRGTKNFRSLSERTSIFTPSSRRVKAPVEKSMTKSINELYDRTLYDSSSRDSNVVSFTQVYKVKYSTKEPTVINPVSTRLISKPGIKNRLDTTLSSFNSGKMRDSIFTPTSWREKDQGSSIINQPKKDLNIFTETGSSSMLHQNTRKDILIGSGSDSWWSPKSEPINPNMFTGYGFNLPAHGWPSGFGGLRGIMGSGGKGKKSSGGWFGRRKNPFAGLLTLNDGKKKGKKKIIRKKRKKKRR